MNILYIMRYWPVYGGGETITVTLANEFVKRGHQVHVAYIYDNVCNPMPYTVDSRIKTIKLYTIEKYKKNDVRKLHSYIASKGVDVMINQWGCTRLCYEARQGTACKLITCWHLDIFQEVKQPVSFKDKILYAVLGKHLYGKMSLRKQLDNHILNYTLSDKYIFLSDSFLKEFLAIKKLKIDCEKVGAISNPLSYDYLYDMDRYDEKKKQVLFVGRIFEYHKRLSYVLKIWEKVEADSSLRDWNLTIVGDGPDMEQTRSLCNQLGLKKVSFEGFKKPNRYYEESSLFMMTSAFEGFGMTLVEAQQYAVVCLAMDSYRSLHDIIINGENGVIVRNNDIEGFFVELKKLMVDSQSRKSLAVAGLASCQKFSVCSIATLWESLFSQLKVKTQ